MEKEKEIATVEKKEEKKYPVSFKAAEVYKDKIVFYNYEHLNFFGTNEERRAIDKAAMKEPTFVYFKGVKKLIFHRFFSTAYVWVKYLDKNEKTKIFKYDCKGVRLGTNLGSVLLNLSIDTANEAIRIYHKDKAKEEK